MMLGSVVARPMRRTRDSVLLLRMPAMFLGLWQPSFDKLSLLTVFIVEHSFGNVNGHRVVKLKLELTVEFGYIHLLNG